MKREDLFLAIGMVEEERLAKTEIAVVQPSGTNKEEPVMKKGKTVRRLITLAAAIAVLSSLVIAASATGLIDQIIAKLHPAEDPGKALGEAYSGEISVDKPDVRDYQDNPIEMPEMERVELDPTQAEQLLGSYVASVEGSIALAGNTITMKNFLMDEVGMGAITYTIENPDGVPYGDAGYGQINLGGIPGQNLLEPEIMVKDDSIFGESSCASRNYLVSKNDDGTMLELVLYFGMQEKPVPGQKLYFQFTTMDSEQETEIEITPLAYAPSVTLTAENGKTAILSSQGISVVWEEAREPSLQDVTIHFADGTDYQVEGENVFNRVLGYWRTTMTKEGKTVSYDSVQELFNRLIDPKEVPSVTIKYDWWEDVPEEEVGENTDKIEYEQYIGGYMAIHHETLTYKP